MLLPHTATQSTEPADRRLSAFETPLNPRVIHTLYGKLIAVPICLGVAISVMFLLIFQYSDNMRRQKTNQVIYRTLAAQFVNEHVVPADAHIDYDAVQGVFDRLRLINPRRDVYLLDEKGVILASSGKTGVRKRDRVSLAPIRGFWQKMRSCPSSETIRENTTRSAYSPSHRSRMMDESTATFT